MVVAGALGGRALAAVGEEAGEDAVGVSGTGVSSDMGWSGARVSVTGGDVGATWVRGDTGGGVSG